MNIEFKIEARHRKEHPNISNFTKFESYMFEPKDMVHF